MKEATGNLNATMVVVVAIGVLSAFFFSVLWPMIKKNNDQVFQCSQAICPISISINELVDGRVYCEVKNGGNSILCPYKG